MLARRLGSSDCVNCSIAPETSVLDPIYRQQTAKCTLSSFRLHFDHRLFFAVRKERRFQKAGGQYSKSRSMQGSCRPSCGETTGGSPDASNRTRILILPPTMFECY